MHLIPLKHTVWKYSPVKICRILLLGWIFNATPIAAADVQWNVSLWGQKRAFTEHVEKLAEVVRKKSNGTFDINLHYGEVLSKARENLDGISFGAFEMAQTCMVYHPDKTPALSVTSLPGLVADGDLETINALYQRIHQHPRVRQEFANWNAKILMPTPVPPSNLVGKGKAPTALSDFAGMRVRTGGPMADIIRGLRGSAVMFSASETYTALDTGATDAVAFPPHAHLAFDTVKLGDWRTKNFNLITGDCPIVVNQDAYDALSDTHKQILTDAVTDALAHYFKAYGVYTEKFLSAAEDMQVVTYSDAQQAEIAKLAHPIWDKWLADMQKKGIDGQSILDTAQGR